MTVHTQPDPPHETETGPTEAKVRRVICVVVSIVAVCAGSMIVMAEPPTPRVVNAIHGVASTRMAVVVPDLSKGERSLADTRHKQVAKTVRSGTSRQNVASPRSLVVAARVREDAATRIAQARAGVDPAD